MAAIKECEHEQQKKWSEAVQAVLARARSGTTHMQDEFGRDVDMMSNERWAARVKSLEKFASDPTVIGLSQYVCVHLCLCYHVVQCLCPCRNCVCVCWVTGFRR